MLFIQSQIIIILEKIPRNRIFEPKNEIIENVEIKRSKIIFEIARRPWISNLEKILKYVNQI